MTVQTLQQTQSKARNATIARIASIGLALTLLAVGALAYRNATVIRTPARVVNAPANIGRPVYTSPAQWSTGSAYDGGAYGRAQASAAGEGRNPILHASSSAYDGGAYGGIQASTNAEARSPILHASSSAYDGGSYGDIDVVASVAMHSPILHASNSAYDGGSYGGPSTATGAAATQ